MKWKSLPLSIKDVFPLGSAGQSLVFSGRGEAGNRAVIPLSGGRQGFSLSSGSNTELTAGDSDRNLDSPGAYSLRGEAPGQQTDTP